MGHSLLCAAHYSTSRLSCNGSLYRACRAYSSILGALRNAGAACAPVACFRDWIISPAPLQTLPQIQWATVQVLAAVLVPTAAVYILEQQARWRFLLNEIKGRL